MKKISIIIAVLVVVAAGGFGIYTLVNKNNTNTVTEHNHADHDHAAEAPAEEQTSSDLIAAVESVTITYTNGGFSPKSVTVKTGGTVTVKNDSSRNVQFDSDPHPAHTDNEELNAEIIKAGASETFTVKQTGTFGYHNHLNASETGTIVVQ